MNIQELSIGDWVRHTFYEENVRIARIYGDSERVLAERGKLSISCHLNHFKPIPLTPEILKKNGFEKLGLSERRWENEEMCIAAVRDTEGKYWVICEADYNRIAPFDVNVYSVHELQHALRLAGINKEIEL